MDDLVELTVKMTPARIRKVAGEAGELGYVCARWVAAHDRPERRLFFVPLADKEGNHLGYNDAVAVEDLQPGDRVAGREVLHVNPAQAGRGWNVLRDGDRVDAFYPPGTLVVLDGDQ